MKHDLLWDAIYRERNEHRVLVDQLVDALTLTMNTMNAKDGPTADERTHATVIARSAITGAKGKH